MPQRIQRKRLKGLRLPANAVSVTRPGRWGNPFKVGDRYQHSHGSISDALTLETCLQVFETYARDRMEEEPGWLEPLRGKDLACYCPEGAACHADILLRLANA